jgi:hypothetical protein
MKANLGGALFLQMIFQGKEKPMGAKRVIKISNLDHQPFGRVPTTSNLTTLTHPK